MGANRRMYPAEWKTVPGFVAHDWAAYRGETTLDQVAASMCETCGILDGDSLIGTSLGGMVACEIASLRRIPRLYLVSSAVRPDEVSALLTLLHPLARYTPLEWVKFSAGKIPAELAGMFADMEPQFIRAMCSAIFEWEGLRAEGTRVFRIHGRHDRVIPPPPSTDLLLDGGHLIAMTLAADCAGFVRAQEQAAPSVP